MKEVRTCGECKWLCEGRCDAPLPAWMQDIDPFSSFSADENRIRTLDMSARYCKAFRRAKSIEEGK